MSEWAVVLARLTAHATHPRESPKRSNCVTDAPSTGSGVVTGGIAMGRGEGHAVGCDLGELGDRARSCLLRVLAAIFDEGD